MPNICAHLSNSIGKWFLGPVWLAFWFVLACWTSIESETTTPTRDLLLGAITAQIGRWGAKGCRWILGKPKSAFHIVVWLAAILLFCGQVLAADGWSVFCGHMSAEAGRLVSALDMEWMNRLFRDEV